MFFESIAVKKFRNLDDVFIEPSTGVNLILGQNAQGKTSLVESIYLLTNLKSFRTKNITDCINFNEQALKISAIASTNAQKQFIKIFLARNLRELELNEKKTNKTRYLGLLKAVEFSPESLAIIKHGPELRRDLLDDAAALFYKDAVFTQTNFQKLLKQRNAVLNKLKKEEYSLKTAEDLLESINPQFVAAATDVTYLRKQILQELLPEMSQILSEIINSNVNLTAEYKSAEERPLESIQYKELMNEFLNQINDPKNKQKERYLGVSNAGPHKHTMNILYDGKNSRFFSSQGQQRALILAFKIAQIVYHEKTLGTHPILLLDDVLSEFDEFKQKYLINFLQNINAQTFLTTTNYAQKINNARTYILDSGKVRTNGT